MFLATTALESYWNTEEPLVFLGEWCCRYDRRHIWEPLQRIMLPNPWDDRQIFKDAYQYVLETTKDVISSLSPVMNQLHKEDLGIRSWQIILGPWLVWYVTALYDRYLRLKEALNRWPDLTTWGLEELAFLTPRDTLEAFFFLNTDFANLQICTQILDALGVRFPRRPMNHQPLNFREADRQRKGNETNKFKILKRKALRFILRQTARINPYHPVIIRNALFSGSQEIQLILKTGLKAWTVSDKIESFSEFKIDPLMRSRLNGFIKEKDEFSKILNKMLPRAIPICFVEGYKDIQNKITKQFPSSPTAILSAGGWHYDELLKAWAAQCLGNNTKILCQQHGGGYGSSLSLFLYEHELAIADKFYSWGWTSTAYPKKVHPLPPAHLFRSELLKANQKKEILFVTTVVYRYFNEFSPLAGSMQKYIAWQQRFIDCLPGEIRKNLTVRLHRQDFDWCLQKRWNDRYPDIKCEYWKVPFRQRLSQCALYVFDHNETTFLESLSANKPSILFWDPEIVELNPDASLYYEELKSVGILHDTPESAGVAVSHIFGQIEAWWSHPRIQTVRENFCRRFALTSRHTIHDWAIELKHLAQEKASP